MTLTQLSYFRAVCRYNSVTAAASELHISQPSVSDAIKELEKEFCVSLFLRDRRGMVLTAEGENFLRLCESLLEHAEQVRQAAEDMGENRKLLRVGVTPLLGAKYIPKLYTDFLPSMPDVRLKIEEGGIDVMSNRLRNNELDIIFLSHSGSVPRDFDSVSIQPIEVVCFMSKDNPLSQRKFVKYEELSHEKIIFYKDNYFFTEYLNNQFQMAGYTPDVLLQTNHRTTIEKMVRKNLAVGFIFRDSMQDVDDIACVPLETPIWLNVSLAWRKDTYVFNCMKEFIRYVKKMDI